MRFINKRILKLGGIILLVLWIIFSLVYISLDKYNEYITRQMSSAYQAGLLDAGLSILKQAEQCEPFSVSVDEQRVDLINTACLSDGSDLSPE